MKSSLSIVSISAEVDPYSKAGGVADVARSLPKALKRLGHSVLAITPLHGSIDVKKHKLKKIITDVPIQIDSTTTKRVHFWQGTLFDDLPIYFVDSPEYFSRRKDVYGRTASENKRFLLFDLAALRLITLLKITPDVIHCHEWHAGLIPWYLRKRFAKNVYLKGASTLYTIHNLAFQMGGNWWEVPLEKKDSGHTTLPSFTSPDVQYLNFAKRGIFYSDIINTVSEQYALEIMTKEYGQHLHTILTNRKDRVFGIVNGIDYFDYNPSTDPGLPVKYDVDSLHLKRKNKRHLQKEFGLPIDNDIPLVGMASRMTEQKGFELIMDIIEPLMRLDLQLAVVGGGDRRYERFWRKAAKAHPKKLGTHLHFDIQKASQIYAASDMYLMPSRFEPCGLGQLISLRYGAIPIVHSVGGLADTVTDYNTKTKNGNGFLFKTYDSRDLLVAISRALEMYKLKEYWDPLVRHAMGQSFSWEIPAKKYVTLFRRAMTYKSGRAKTSTRRKSS